MRSAESQLLTAASLSLGLLARRSGTQLVLAESCTAGLAAHVISRTPGSSAWLLGGLVAYSNAFKAQHLGVPSEVLVAHGAVSAQTAEAMALGAIQLACCALEAASGWQDPPKRLLSISITGIAGPDGARPGKPVGLVWFGLAEWRASQQAGEMATRFIGAESRHFSGGRSEVQEATALHALALLTAHAGAKNPPFG